MLTLNNVCWKPDDGDAVLKGIDLCVKPGRADRGDGP